MSRNADWGGFFQCWNRKIIGNFILQTLSKDQTKEKSSLLIVSDYEKEVSDYERENWYKLPPSYRSFMVSLNGNTGAALYRNINDERPFFTINKVEKFSRTTGQYLETYKIFDETGYFYDVQGNDSEYYLYKDGKTNVGIKKEHLSDLLLIGSFGDSGYFLLNPKVVTKNGEWEAWYLTWKQDTIRYESFTRMMIDFYDDNMGIWGWGTSCKNYISTK